MGTFLTFRNLHTDWEGNALKQLFENLQSNITVHPSVRDAFFERYREHNVADLEKKNIEACISQAVVKWLVDRAHEYEIQLDRYICCQYDRYPIPFYKYTIFKQILIFSPGTPSIAIIPTKGTPRETWMESNLVKCIQQHKPIDVVEKIVRMMDTNPSSVDELKTEIIQLRKGTSSIETAR